MKTSSRLLVFVVVMVSIIGVLLLKKNNTPMESDASQLSTVTSENASAKLPKLLDLGAGKCVPCKMMAPILEELKKEYVGQIDVEFIDVWQNPDAGKLYNVEMIPTQIFYDIEGKEVFRHVGFLGKQEILEKCKELGFLQ